MPTTPAGTDDPGGALADWQARIGRRSERDGRAGPAALPPPASLTACGGVGHVTLTWAPVDGAVGYLVHRSEGTGSPFLPVDHQGGDVLAVPGTTYTDTTGVPGRTYQYAVSSVPEVTAQGAPGEPVAATSRAADGAAPTVQVNVDAAAEGVPLERPWRPMIGSERLSQLLCTDETGGRPVGAELLAALRRVRDELGVAQVRAHAVLHDDLGVYREVDGSPVHDFARVDEVYDLVLGTGLRPVVEIGFMPRALAREAAATVFGYGAGISPPKDWDRWAGLVRGLVQHLVDRYGLDEVLGWDFEVWNEPNLEVFWSSTREEWMHLYDVTAGAVKAVDPRLAVGGPSSAAAGWVDDLLAHVAESGAPVDFVSTHTYGNAPLDVRPLLARHGREDARILWTEWGVTPTHFNPVNDGVSSATFLLTGMRSAAGRLDALSSWVASDHFEELGRPPRLLHGGFGLLTVGGIAKPRYHAMRMLAALGPVELPATLDGDGAGGLVQAWASRREDGSLAVLLWNDTLDQGKADGDPALARSVRLVVAGARAQRARLTRLDRGHGDVTALAASLGVADWPTEEQWQALAAADSPASEPCDVEPTGGDAVLTLDLPQPGAVLVELPS